MNRHLSWIATRCLCGLAVTGVTLLAGCGSMLPPQPLNSAERGAVETAGNLGVVEVAAGPGRLSTGLVRLLQGTGLFSAVVAAPSTRPPDFVATRGEACERGAWTPSLATMLTLGIVPTFDHVRQGYSFVLRDAHTGQETEIPCEIDVTIGVGWIPALMSVLPGWTLQDAESTPRFKERLAYNIASRMASRLKRPRS
jgi:hypothetical protein